MTLTTSRSSWLSGDSPNTGSCLQLLLLPLLSAIDWGASHRSEVSSTESSLKLQQTSNDDSNDEAKWTRQPQRLQCVNEAVTIAIFSPGSSSTGKHHWLCQPVLDLHQTKVSCFWFCSWWFWFCCWWLSCCCLYSLWWRFCSLLFCWTYFLCRFEITDGDGNVALKILGPWCTYSCAGDVEFKVFFSNSG